MQVKDLMHVGLQFQKLARAILDKALIETTKKNLGITLSSINQIVGIFRWRSEKMY